MINLALNQSMAMCCPAKPCPGEEDPVETHWVIVDQQYCSAWSKSSFELHRILNLFQHLKLGYFSKIGLASRSYDPKVL